jgi:hypothetical protein
LYERSPGSLRIHSGLDYPRHDNGDGRSRFVAFGDDLRGEIQKWLAERNRIVSFRGTSDPEALFPRRACGGKSAHGPPLPRCIAAVAIRSFFRHLVRNDLTHAAQYQQVLAATVQTQTISGLWMTYSNSLLRAARKTVTPYPPVHGSPW